MHRVKRPPSKSGESGFNPAPCKIKTCSGIDVKIKTAKRKKRDSF